MPRPELNHARPVHAGCLSPVVIKSINQGVSLVLSSYVLVSRDERRAPAARSGGQAGTGGRCAVHWPADHTWPKAAGPRGARGCCRHPGVAYNTCMSSPCCLLVLWLRAGGRVSAMDLPLSICPPGWSDPKGPPQAIPVPQSIASGCHQAPGASCPSCVLMRARYGKCDEPLAHACAHACLQTNRKTAFPTALSDELFPC